MASQTAEMNKLKEQIEKSQETVSSAQAQIEQANVQVTTYENLIKAYSAYLAGNYTSAGNVLQNVQPDLLSVDAKEIYDSIYADIKSTMMKNLKTQGEVAFYAKDYATAIDYFTQAMEMDDKNYELLNLLAHSYRYNEQYENAVEIFQKIVDQFPGKRARSAQNYIDSLKQKMEASGPDTGDMGNANNPGNEQ